MWWSTFRLSVRNLLLHKMRSTLTLLGTILGVASVIAMLSIGEGSKQEALERIRSLGANNVIIRTLSPGEAEDGGDNNSSTSAVTSRSLYQVNAYGLTYEDLRVLEDLPTKRSVVPVMMQRRDVSQGGNRLGEARVVATTPELSAVRNIQVRRGRFLQRRDREDMANVAVLTQGAATELFGYSDPLDQPILVGGTAFRVVGVLSARDSGIARAGESGGDDANRDIFVPLETGRARFGFLTREAASSREFDRVELSEITIAVADGDQVAPTATMVRDLLEKRHTDATDYQVLVPLELMAQAEHEKRIWNLVLGAIAGISLLVGGIGIMNIMLATVTERTREIGIRRAIGAKRRDIIRQFLVETTVLSATGGLLGIFLGISIPMVVTAVAGMQTVTSVASIALAFGISVAIGIIFGVYPAYKAAAMNPIEALRQQ
ncbi:MULTISPECIES: ABC transporter permease [Crateriforma]|uniref:Macrolide export ATP-binding/permease protein MacB n=1 Tax=Crateriforma conspicua TaxID=2527996 RepID=A0A5C6FU94_9PLAN|nr:MULTISPECIES: ABC transporter permease [Crateriforma]TWU65048.1 Macrolide export ATP-binding/permease protein MacB [Crateriforma conspicua]